MREKENTMSKPKTGAQIAKALAKQEKKGAELNGPQKDAARAHRTAQQARRGVK